MATARAVTSSESFRRESGWREFVRRFPTEEACVKELCKLFGMDTKCSCANNSNIREKIYGARLVKCAFCRRKRRLTAGTFFHGVRKVRPWLAAIFFFEQGIPINAFQFHKLVGVAYATAFSILKKLTVVIHSAMQEGATVLIPSSLFLSVFTKRSRETPARGKPSSEQEAVDNLSSKDEGRREPQAPSKAPVNSQLLEADIQLGAINVTSEELKPLRETNAPIIEDPVEKAIYECLSLKPTTYDTICERVGVSVGDLSAALTCMELSGLVERLPGDQYVRFTATVTSKACPQFLGDGSQKKQVEEVMNYLRSKFGGISRKYLQHYISIFWCHADRKRWGLGTLFKLCLRFRRVSYAEILAYVSPPLVQIAKART
jgi:hypothetical protein